MRRLPFSFLLTSCALMLFSCVQDECTETRTFFQYDPVYYHPDAFRTPTLTVESPRTLKKPGKLYFYKNYMLVNELGQGIHLINVENVANPVMEAFIPILGNFDMAIREGILYADNVVNLIAIDLNDLSNPRIVQRVENYQSDHYHENSGFLSHYEKTPRSIIVDCSDEGFNEEVWQRGGQWFAVEDLGGLFDASGSAGPEGSVGIGGSFARFTIYDHYLYTVDNHSLSAWDIEDSQLALLNTTNLGWGIETIFPYRDKLFIGSNSGMHIFENSNPSSPYFVSTFEHARACDTVVVEGNTAYVTLRNGTECQGFINQLDIIDIANIYNPKLIKSYNMDHPHGLAVRDSKLYLGEGEYGLKTFDVADPEHIDQLQHLKVHHVYDVISLNPTTLFVIGDDGFYVYDSSKPDDLKELSHIPVNR